MADDVGRKDDAGKLRYDLMPVDAEKMVVEVLTYGSTKYAPENWRKVMNPEQRYYAAARRHIEAWRKGELTDTETGLHHLSHAICCLLFQLQLDIENKPVFISAEACEGLLREFRNEISNESVIFTPLNERSPT